MVIDWKLIKSDIAPVDPPEDYEEPEAVWRCYCCGNTGGFTTVSTWTDYGYEYDVECDECGSENTSLDGEGSHFCEQCQDLGAYCSMCALCHCEECWKWFPAEEEPDDYICEECL